MTALMTGPVQAAVIFDQIDPAYTIAAAAQQQSASPFSVQVADDFTLASSASVEAVVFDLTGFTTTGSTAPRFTSFGNILGWRVGIWSSEAEVRDPIFGPDVFSQLHVTSAATYLNGQPVIPAGGLEPGQSVNTLVRLPLVKELGPGTYWLAVTPLMNFSNGQTGIRQGGSGNMLQINFGGGFGFPGGINERLTNAAYRLEGTLAEAPVTGAVPEPAS